MYLTGLLHNNVSWKIFCIDERYKSLYNKSVIDRKPEHCTAFYDEWGHKDVATQKSSDNRSGTAFAGG